MAGIFKFFQPRDQALSQKRSNDDAMTMLSEVIRRDNVPGLRLGMNRGETLGRIIDFVARANQ